MKQVAIMMKKGNERNEKLSFEANIRSLLDFDHLGSFFWYLCNGKREHSTINDPGFIHPIRVFFTHGNSIDTGNAERSFQ